MNVKDLFKFLFYKNGGRVTAEQKHFTGGVLNADPAATLPGDDGEVIALPGADTQAFWRRADDVAQGRVRPLTSATPGIEPLRAPRPAKRANRDAPKRTNAQIVAKLADKLFLPSGTQLDGIENVLGLPHAGSVSKRIKEVERLIG